MVEISNVAIFPQDVVFVTWSVVVRYRSSSGGQKRGERGERGEREKGMGGGRGLPSKRSSSREMSKERESAIRVPQVTLTNTWYH